jgi:hypothetical protein
MVHTPHLNEIILEAAKDMKKHPSERYLEVLIADPGLAAKALHDATKLWLEVLNSNPDVATLEDLNKIIAVIGFNAVDNKEIEIDLET